MNYKEGDILSVSKKMTKEELGEWGTWVLEMDKLVGRCGVVTNQNRGGWVALLAPEKSVHLYFEKEEKAYWFPLQCICDKSFAKSLVTKYKKSINNGSLA
jgi:hypothetical protein